jgi:putative isomerase
MKNVQANRAAWLSFCQPVVSSRDYRLLDKASGILLQNIAPNTPETLWNPWRAITPSMAPNPSRPGLPCFGGIWNWDSAFHMIGIARFDRQLAQEQMEAFFLFQKDNGMLPDVIRTPDYQNRIEDLIGKPPVWAWALEQLDRRQPDPDFLRRMYPKLVRNEHFWRTQRFCETDGLFFYSALVQGPMRDLYIRWESGLDDSIRFDDAVIESLYPIDLNCFMVSFYRSMQYLAMRLEKPEDATRWAHRARALAERICTVLWSEADQCFWDWNFKTQDFIRVLTPAAFMPLWAGIASPAQAAALEKYAADPQKLYPCMPTVSLDHPKLNPTGYWRGSVWMNVAYFAIKGLYDYGFRTTAMGIRDTLLNWMDQDVSIHENYNPLTGAGKCCADLSWSCVFAMEMILEMPVV